MFNIYTEYIVQMSGCRGKRVQRGVFLRGHCSVAHTPAPAPAVRFLFSIKVTITPLSITTHNSMSLSLHWGISTKILCPTDSDIYSLCVCDTCKAELGKCSAVVSPPLARRLLLHPPPAAAKRPYQAAPGPPPGPIRRNCWGQAKDYFDHHVTRSG